MTEQALNTREAAEILGLSGSYLEKLRADGRGPDYARIGRRVIYRKPDLDAWVEAKTRRISR